jgi:thiol-disulfide isomerase/thioredoxin
MKKIILMLVVNIAVFSVLLLIAGTVRKGKKHDYIENKIASLPAFSFMTLSNEAFNSSDIKEGPVLVVHFHPECEHCQYEISEILKNNIPKSYNKVILISSAHPDSIRKFLKGFNCTDFQSVIPLTDISYNFEDIFGSGIIPSIYIYNKKLKLVKIIHGEVRTEVLIKSLQESD